MEERTKVTTPLWISDILLGGVLIALAMYLFPDFSPRELLPQNWFWLLFREHVFTSMLVFLIGLLFVLKGGTHYTICPSGLVVRLFWIPIRLIRWSHIGNAEVLGAWISGEHTRKTVYGRKRTGRMYWDKGTGIFVTTRFCPGYVAEAEVMDLFCLKHPIGAVFLRFYPLHQQRYVELFRKYYPKLEIQFEAEQQMKNHP